MRIQKAAYRNENQQKDGQKTGETRASSSNIKDEKETDRKSDVNAEGGSGSSKAYRMTYNNLEEKIKDNATIGLFAAVAFFGLLNFPKLLLISKFWAIVGSIVCPLIVIVIPGCFYYQVRRALDEKNRPYRYMGTLFAILGLLLLPFFLTLSTKNLFTGPEMQVV